MSKRKNQRFFFICSKPVNHITHNAIQNPTLAFITVSHVASVLTLNFAHIRTSPTDRCECFSPSPGVTLATSHRGREAFVNHECYMCCTVGFFVFTQLEQLCMIHSSGTFGCTVQTWSWKSTWVLTSVPEAIIVHISTLSEFIQTDKPSWTVRSEVMLFNMSSDFCTSVCTIGNKEELLQCRVRTCTHRSDRYLTNISDKFPLVWFLSPVRVHTLCQTVCSVLTRVFHLSERRMQWPMERLQRVGQSLLSDSTSLHF